MKKPCKSSWRDYPTEIDITVQVSGEPEMIQLLQLIDNREQVIEALRHASVAIHHPHCKCRGEYSANPEKYCTCHVQKARAALELLANRHEEE